MAVMREIDLSMVTTAVKELSVEANTAANSDLSEALGRSFKEEESPQGKAVLKQLLENHRVAETTGLPICQDTGFAVVFLEVGTEVHFTGGDVRQAVDEGVRQGYTEGFLRKSIVKNPLTDPVNTGDNTPSVIHTELVPGDKVKITFLPKGGGSENMSRIKMMMPSEGVEGVRKFILDTVRSAGANPCPPVIVGVGVGGTFDYVAYLAKKALVRKIGERNADPEIADMERRWLEDINKLGIGPAGLGGRVTAMELFLEVFPRHIATFPVAVNIQCNAARFKTRII